MKPDRYSHMYDRTETGGSFQARCHDLRLMSLTHNTWSLGDGYDFLQRQNARFQIQPTFLHSRLRGCDSILQKLMSLSVLDRILQLLVETIEFQFPIG